MAINVGLSLSRSFIKRQTSRTSSDNEWYNEWHRIATSDNEWQRVEWKRVTTGDIEWREVTTSGNFGQTSFFQIIWCWYEPFFISLRQRLLQTVVIDVFKIYVNLSKSTIVVFLKLSTSYLLFIIKMCVFFFDEKQMFCFVLQKDAHLSLTCFVIKQKPLVKQWKHMESSCKIEDWILYWFFFFLIYKKIYILEFIIVM